MLHWGCLKSYPCSLGVFEELPLCPLQRKDNCFFGWQHLDFPVVGAGSVGRLNLEEDSQLEGMSRFLPQCHLASRRLTLHAACLSWASWGSLKESETPNKSYACSSPHGYVDGHEFG